MPFDEIANTVFFRLPLFKPGHGFYIDDLQGKYDFLTYMNNESDWEKMHFQQHDELNMSITSFVNIIEENVGLRYTCTEHNLINLFLKPEQIAVNEHRKITNTQLSSYADFYKEGYDNGSKISIIAAFGESYMSLSLELKTEVIEEFCRQCHKYSFFEGFTVPDCLKGIGYLQGLLFNAFKEFLLLKKQQLNQTLNRPGKLPEESLTIIAKNEVGNNRNAGQVIQSDNTISSDPPDLRISLRSTDLLKAIELLWSLLLMPIDDYPIVVKSRTDIGNIVRQLFYVKSDTKKYNRKDIIDLAIFETRHRGLIEFLMRFSKLMIEGNTQNNTIYCSLLKYSFLGIYEENHQNKGVSVKSIGSHWMKKTNECLQNLRKIDLPKPIFDLINEIMNQSDFKAKPLTRYK